MSNNIENKDLSVKSKKELYEEKKVAKTKAKLAKQKEEQSALSKTIKGYLPSVLNWVFFFSAVVVLALGLLIITGALQIKATAPIIGSIPTAFAWILIVIGAITVIYAIYPIFLPAFPELRKISWLKGKSYLGNSIRVFLFLIIFACLFLLYDTFITEVLRRILG